MGHDHYALKKYETGLQNVSAPRGERPGQAGVRRPVAPKQDSSEAGLFSSFRSLYKQPQCGLTHCPCKLLTSRRHQNVVLLKMAILKLLILVSVTVNGNSFNLFEPYLKKQKTFKWGLVLPPRVAVTFKLLNL